VLVWGAIGLVFWSAVLFVLVRFGLLALAAWIFFGTGDLVAPTTDLSAWYAGRTIVALLILGGLACYGFWISLAGRPLFARDLLEEPAQ